MLAIQARAIRKQFGDFVAVSDVGFEVSEGENFGLLGPNGAGKSTLIRILTTLLLPSSGTALVAGHDVLKDADRVRKSIGVVPQALTSDPQLTAAENLDFCAKLHSVPLSTRRKLIEELLASMDLLEWRNKLVGTFSGGMRRRLEIARGLVHRPRVLFLDEPTTGLDPASRLAMWQMLRQLKSQSTLTICLTTHYMEEADQLCDRIAIFDRGKIVTMDTPANLKACLPTTESVEVEFASTPPGWTEVVAGLPGVVSVQVLNGSCRIESRDRTRTLNALLQAASERAVTISSLAVRGNTLDDVFIHYTGRDTRDAAQAQRSEVSFLYEKKLRA